MSGRVARRDPYPETTMATVKAVKGFKVTCPMCGDVEATIALDLNDVRSLTCSSCSSEFTPAAAVAKAAEQLARWQAVARGVELAGECLAECRANGEGPSGLNHPTAPG